MDQRPTFEEFKNEILSHPRLSELESVYFLAWEEGAHDVSPYLETDDAFTKMADFLNDLSQKQGRDIPFVLITAAPEGYWPVYFDKNDPRYRLIKLIHFPTYLIHRTQYRIGPEPDPHPPQEDVVRENYHYNLTTTGLDLCDPYTGLNNTEFKHTYLYMVLYPKFHRSMVMDMLAKHDLHQYGAISWREFNRTLDRSTIPEGRLDSQHDIGDSPFPWTYWQPKRLFLDQPVDTPGPVRYDWLPAQYNDCFFQIIGESIDNWPLISEKTVTPLFFNKPFLVASGAYSHRLLEELGFKLYDEIFDYSFDSEPNLKKRMEGLVLNVIKVNNLLKEHGSAALMNMIKDKLVYNKLRAHELTVNENYIPKELTDFFAKEPVPCKKHRDQNNSIFKIFPFFEYAKKFNSSCLKK